MQEKPLLVLKPTKTFRVFLIPAFLTVLYLEIVPVLVNRIPLNLHDTIMLLIPISILFLLDKVFASIIYLIYNDRIIIEYHFISKHKSIINLSNVSHINCLQIFNTKKYNVGDIYLYNPSQITLRERWCLICIENPQLVVEQLKKLIDTTQNKETNHAE